MCGPFWKSPQRANTRDESSSQQVNRRDIVKTAAGLGAMVAVGSGVSKVADSTGGVAHAQEVDGTRARSWSEPENINTDIKLEGDGWVTLQTEFPFWALGFGWDLASGTWPAVEFGVSFDGETWDDGYFMAARNDGGPKATDNRHHTDLFFADGHEFIRYRTMDGEGNLVILERFQVTYIDPTDGPWEGDRGITMMRTSAVNDDTLVPPTIITRAQWGANESLRYDGGSEIWPPEYQEVQHAIVHHAAVNYGSDGYNAVRSIYYYHAVTQGWGDIGYNYVVDTNGNIFEGRVGGANVIGGHAFEYANGSSGICVMGDFTNIDPPHVAKVALANIIAYVTRDLNPHGSKPFHSVPALPTICAHRDVNQSTCPGNALYDDLPWLRNQVKNILDQGLLDSQNPGAIVPGDWVRVQTENSTPLPMRRGAGMDQGVIAYIPHNTLIEVERGPLSDSSYNWYEVFYDNQLGWVPADYLLVDPPIDEPTDGYTYGQNVRLTATTSLRREPNGSSTGTVPSGAWAFILAGATPSGGTTWFQLRTQSHGDGWVPRSAITLAPVYNPTPRFPVGSNVVTTVAAPIRVRPGISQTAGGTVPAGRTLQVSVAPIAVTDRIWYGVYGGTGTGGGWIEEGHLRAGANSIIVVGQVTDVGQQFRTTDSVNLRGGPGTGFSIVATLSTGIMGSVTGGPQAGSGYQWWQVRTDANQVGWLAGDFIEQIRSGPGGNLTGFGVGVTVRTNTSVNMRSDGGVGYPVVATLATNTDGTIIDGPRVATGYTWWRIRTVSGQIGWVTQTYLVRTSGLPPEFQIGDGVRFTRSSQRRSNPALPNTRVTPDVPGGSWAVVIAGPSEAFSRLWWRVRSGRLVGWVPQEVLTRGTKLVPGMGVRTTQRVTTLTDVNNWDSRGAIAGGQFGAVISGPQFAHGYLWYSARFPDGIYWVPQDYLQSHQKFSTGTGVRTTQRVTTLTNINDWDSRGAISEDVFGAIISAPQWTNGHLWYFVRFPSGVVWVPQDYLEVGLKFSAGTGVRTTQRVTTLTNVDDWETRGVQQEGIYGAVYSAPRWGHGNLWFPVRFTEGVLWVPQDYLEPGNKFSVGTQVVTTQRVTGLANVTNWATAIAIAGDSTGLVILPARWSHGRLWFAVRFPEGSYWVPQDFLQIIE